MGARGPPPAWTELLSAPPVAHLHLHALDRDDTAALLAQTFDAPADDAVVDLIVERSGGHPLFADELAVEYRSHHARIDVAAAEEDGYAFAFGGFVGA